MTDLHIWTPSEVKAFWDYESQYPQNYWSYQHGMKLLDRFSNLIGNSSHVLDLGCGNGGLIAHLLDVCSVSGQSVYGFDTSLESIQNVNQKFHGSKYFKGAFHDSHDLLTASNQKMDLIFCCEVIEHLYDADLDALMNTAFSLLKPATGRLVITTPNQEDLSSSYIFNPVSETLFHRWQHVRSWDAVLLGKAIESRGFTVCAINEIDLETFGTFNRVKSKLKGAIGKKVMPNLVALVSINDK